jgi:hypothetical protein
MSSASRSACLFGLTLLSLSCGSSTTASGVARDGNYVFQTSTTYFGDLGGVAGADHKCSDVAAAAGFTGTYRAWISTSTENAIDRISGNGPWVSTANPSVVVFKNHAALAVGSQAPIVDENGKTYGGSQWTGSRTDGTVSVGHTCSDWTTKAAGCGGTGGPTPPQGAVASANGFATQWPNGGTYQPWGGDDSNTGLYCGCRDLPIICFRQ